MSELNTTSSLNYRPFITVVILLLLFGAGWYILNSRTKHTTQTNKNVAVSPTKTATLSAQLQLPPLWEQKNDVPGFEMKAVKKTITKIKPVVNLVKTTKKDEDQKTYVDKMIKGAKSSFPSLVITKDNLEEKDGFYIRELTGYYYNGKNKISLLMNIYIKKDTVYTLTAAKDSTDNTTTNDEITKIFASVYTTIINK
jgi:hypothetical protein